MSKKIPCSHVIAICIRYWHDAEQYIDPCNSVDALFWSYAPVFPVLKDRLSWPDPEETQRVLPNPRLIREKGHPVSTQIRNEMDEGGKRPRTTPWKEGGGRCNASCVTKRGITEEHALSETRYRRVVVSQTRYAKFELRHSSKCNLKQNACYMPFNYVFL